MRSRRVLQAHFRPEFLNRIDEIVVFHPLGREHLAGDRRIQLRRVCQLLADKGYKLEVTEAAREYLAESAMIRISARGRSNGPSSVNCRIPWP